MRRNRLVAVGLILVLLCSVGFTGCGNFRMGSGNRLVVQLGDNPETLDPAKNSAADALNIINLLFETLLKQNENMELEPGAADRWKVSKDGLTWTFHLREGLTWSDGSAVTAADYVYAWQRIANPEVESPYAETLLGMVEGYDSAQEGNLKDLGVTAKDDQNLVVHLSRPCAYFGALVSMGQMAPLKKSVVKKHGETWATSVESYLCNGAFTMKSWNPETSVVVEKNPRYWNAKNVHFEEIEFLLTDDAEKAYTAYQKGHADIISSIPPGEIEAIRENPEFKTYPSIATYYVSLNLDLPVFQDERVRRALSLALDREYLAGTVMDGLFTPAYNLIGPGVQDYDNRAFRLNANGGEPYISTNYKKNLEEAKRLLKESGHPGGQGIPELSYKTNDMDYHMVAANYLKDAWANLGITVKVEKVKWDEFTVERRKGNYELARNGWAFDYSDASNFLELFTSGNGNNDGRFRNEEYDRIIELAAHEADPKVRSGYLHEAENILMEETACIPLAYYNDFYLVNSHLKGVWHSPTGVWNFQYGSFQ